VYIHHDTRYYVLQVCCCCSLHTSYTILVTNLTLCKSTIYLTREVLIVIVYGITVAMSTDDCVLCAVVFFSVSSVVCLFVYMV